MREQLVPFVCVPCRKSFKRPIALPRSPCPDCTGETTKLAEKFQAPKRRDDEGWEVVAFVLAHGFRYHSERVYETGGNSWQNVPHPYPRTMAEAREFVVRYADSPARERPMDDAGR